MITDSEIRNQSENAYKQWCVRWRENAKIHSQFQMKSLEDYENSGVGRAILVVANGRSLQRKIELIKKHQDNVDILCCDKSLGVLLDNGITPTFCMVCDAQVSDDKYLDKWKDQLKNTVLLINACGNTAWTKKGNWKDKYFFVNMDILKSEKEFMRISGCQNKIAAGTNVSNAMVIMLTQCDQSGRKNFFGYDKIILIGFDYCWRSNEYYAFNDNGDGKDNYQRHTYLLDNKRELSYSSHNLVFSARWFEQYIKTFNLPIVQCSEGTIAPLYYSDDFEHHLQYKYKSDDAKIVKPISIKRKKLTQQLNQETKALMNIGTDHFWSYKASV